jgi:hypothetical protein
VWGLGGVAVTLITAALAGLGFPPAVWIATLVLGVVLLCWAGVVLLRSRDSVGTVADDRQPDDEGRAQPDKPELPELPRSSIVIGGPGTKVGRVSITDGYSNNPEGLAAIFGDEIQDARLERNIHDVPPRPTADHESDDEGQDGTDN